MSQLLIIKVRENTDIEPTKTECEQNLAAAVLDYLGPEKASQIVDSDAIVQISFQVFGQISFTKRVEMSGMTHKLMFTRK